MSDPSLIVLALFDRAALMATTGPTLPVAFPEHFDPATDAIFAPPADGKYLEVFHLPNRPGWEGLASGRLDQGLLQINVVWPKNKGIVAPYAVAAQVMTHFAKGTILTSGAARVKVSAEPWTNQPDPEDSETRIPVLIPWTA
jgi:hypothetical protein